MVTNFFDGLLDSNLVVDGHHGHQRRVGADGGLQQLHTETPAQSLHCGVCRMSACFTQYLQVQQAILLHGQVRNVEAFSRQNPTRVQDTFMFGLSGDHMTPLGLVEPGHTLQERN